VVRLVGLLLLAAGMISVPVGLVLLQRDPPVWYVVPLTTILFVSGATLLIAGAAKRQRKTTGDVSEL
jgi:hypothetical protein